MNTQRPPLPPFTLDSYWRNRAEFVQGREAIVHDAPIREAERRFHWPQGRRPDGFPGLGDFGF